MFRFHYGFKRGIKEIIIGFIIIVVVRGLLGANNLEYLVILFDVVSILAIILLIDKIKFWSIGYLFGWFLGVILFYTILSPLELLLYGGVFIVALGLKFKYKIKRYFSI